MKRISSIIGALLVVSAGAYGATLPGSGTVAEVDLASDTAWTLSMDGGSVRPIKVPGGGWNSDAQEPRIDRELGVKDFVVYERKIEVPKEAAGNVVMIRFGAVNYGAEVLLDDKRVATHAGPMMPFEADITDLVQPGKTYTLKVKAYHRRHYDDAKGECHVPIGFDYEFPYRKGTRYNAKFAYGITKYVRLVVLPPVYIKDLFVQPSVKNRTLTVDVWIRNHTAVAKELSLTSALTSWNHNAWKYPEIPDQSVKVDAGQTAKVTIGPVAWELGSKSYWWPNIPFKEDYLATLHNLKLRVTEKAWLPLKAYQEKTQRFGFCENAEGPFYYTINGVRVNNFSDATAEPQMSYYDCYSRAPAFLPPTGPGTGMPETWKRYMRLGMNINRIHQSTPTEYMMEVADELGFMMVPETGIRGCENQACDVTNLTQAVHELVTLCRNHPSVVRYSVFNETQTWPEMIDAAWECDPTRPIVTEGCGSAERKNGKKAHAYNTVHYSGYATVKSITMMGEYAWGTDCFEEYAWKGRFYRNDNVCYMAGWSLLNYWPNFLEGMSHDKHAWIQNNHADRKDGVDGWGSPTVKFVQRCLHPYLVLDSKFEMFNPTYSPDWPRNRPLLSAGQDATREIEVFNGGLTGNAMSLEWEARWDSANGEKVAAGWQDFIAEPGFHVTRSVTFKAPAVEKERNLFLVMRSLLNGKVVFTEDKVSYRVGHRDERLEAVATFVGTDEATQGNWKGKYGSLGYEIMGADTNLPPAVKRTWDAEPWIWTKATSEVRALWYFANPQTDTNRIAACRSGAPMSVTLDVGETPTQVALYFLDWERNRRGTVEIRGADNVLDTRDVGSFENGKYMIWKIKGRVVFVIKHEAGPNAMVSGLFFDPVK